MNLANVFAGVRVCDATTAADSPRPVVVSEPPDAKTARPPAPEASGRDGGGAPAGAPASMTPRDVPLWRVGRANGRYRLIEAPTPSEAMGRVKHATSVRPVYDKRSRL